jgi:cobalt-zinc-cadmium efflux system protein
MAQHHDHDDHRKDPRPTDKLPRRHDHAHIDRRHHHGHDHGHEHGHDHGHVPTNIGRAFAIGVALNLAFVAVEASYGLIAHSVALVADAAHNLSDVLGLMLAWGASVLAKRKPSRRRTYGLRRSTILASLANAVLLLFVVVGVAWEAIQRLCDTRTVAGGTVIAIAAAGVVVNGVTALLFMKGRDEDANVRGAFLHLAADAAVSLGVVVAGLVILKTGWMWLDPAVSFAVLLVILVSTWSLLRQALDLALDAVPAHIDAEAVRAYLAGLPSVASVHDLHIWAMSTTEVALTAHLVIPQGACKPTFLREVCHTLHDRFRIEHSTLQVEPPEAPECRLAPEEVL